jgi:glutamyl-tRNA reductase
MDQIGVVGLSYRHAGSEEIAGFAIPREAIPTRLPQLKAALQVEELAFLSTCNRVEVVFATSSDHSAQDCRREVFRALTGREPGSGEARSALRAWTGEAAIEHLFLLACGLDSAQAGEREIAAQLRAAWQAARAADTCGPTLDHVFGEALGMASRVQQIATGERVPSLADLAVDRMLHHLAGRPPAPVALVGVSAMTRRSGELLHEAGVSLIVTNRSPDAAVQFAQTLADRAANRLAPVRGASIRTLPLEVFKAAPPEVAGLIVATGGTEPVLDENALMRLLQAASRAPLIVDFGLPANVDPAAARRRGIARVGMDELIEAAQERRIAHLMRLAPVRAAIDERLCHLRNQLAARTIGKQLAELRDAFERIAADELDRLLAGDMHGLDAQQKAHLQRFATTIARRLAHLPLAGMRAAAAHGNTEILDAFFREARLQRAPATAVHHRKRS